LVDELSATEEVIIIKMMKMLKMAQNMQKWPKQLKNEINYLQSSATRGMTISCSLKLLKREKISQNFGMIYALVEATLNRPSSII